MKGGDKPKPNQPLKWTMEYEAAFKKLKWLFTAKLVLKHPNPNKLFVNQADASNVAMEVILMQENEQGQL